MRKLIVAALLAAALFPFFTASSIAAPAPKASPVKTHNAPLTSCYTTAQAPVNTLSGAKFSGQGFCPNSFYYRTLYVQLRSPAYGLVAQVTVSGSSANYLKVGEIPCDEGGTTPLYTRSRLGAGGSYTPWVNSITINIDGDC